MFKRMNILLATDAPPIRGLGGPGKFVPLLFEALQSNEGTQASVQAIVRGSIAETPSNIMYTDILLGNSNKSRVIKQLIHKGYYGSVLAKEVASLVVRKKLKGVMNDFAPQVINAHDFASVGYFADANIPLILTSHFKGSLYREYLQGFPWYNSLKWESYFRKQEINSISRADYLTFPSQSALQLLVDDYPQIESEIRSKASIIYTGIPVSRSAEVQRESELGSRLILNIGNHIHDKGVDLALRLFSQMFNKSDEMFVNAGAHGPETQKLIELSKKLGVGDRVKFLGRVDPSTIDSLMSKAFLMLHTPRRVVFDLVILEAMLKKTPILATLVLGNQEALGEDHKLFVSVSKLEGDYISSVTNELSKIIACPEEMSYISDHEYARVTSKYTTRAMVDGYLKMYERVLGVMK